MKRRVFPLISLSLMSRFLSWTRGTARDPFRSHGPLLVSFEERAVFPAGSHPPRFSGRTPRWRDGARRHLDSPHHAKQLLRPGRFPVDLPQLCVVRQILHAPPPDRGLRGALSGARDHENVNRNLSCHELLPTGQSEGSPPAGHGKPIRVPLPHPGRYLSEGRRPFQGKSGWHRVPKTVRSRPPSTWQRGQGDLGLAWGGLRDRLSRVLKDPLSSVIKRTPDSIRGTTQSRSG